jgi:hypothetical protein
MKNKSLRTSRVDHHDVSSLSTPKKVFEDKAKEEQTKREFEFADPNIEKFGAKLNVNSEDVNDQQTERNFISGTINTLLIYFIEDGSASGDVNLQNLNLFGVPMTETQEEGDNKETQKILRELLHMAEDFDSGELQNFKVRKSFIYYDVIFI